MRLEECTCSLVSWVVSDSSFIPIKGFGPWLTGFQDADQSMYSFTFTTSHPQLPFLPKFLFCNYILEAIGEENWLSESLVFMSYINVFLSSLYKATTHGDMLLPQYRHHWVLPLLVQVHSQSQKIRQLEAEVKAKTRQLQDLLPDNNSEDLRII